MHRGWMDNPVLAWGRDPFCRRAAWVWRIEEAAWADRRVSLGGKTVTIHRSANAQRSLHGAGLELVKVRCRAIHRPASNRDNDRDSNRDRIVGHNHL